MKKHKWTPLQTDEYTGARFTFIEGLQPSGNVHGHGVIIFVDKVKPYKGLSVTKTQYTVQVCGGPYGETSDSETLPLGSKLSAAKVKAESILRHYVNEGLICD